MTRDDVVVGFVGLGTTKKRYQLAANALEPIGLAAVCRVATSAAIRRASCVNGLVTHWDGLFDT